MVATETEVRTASKRAVRTLLECLLVPSRLHEHALHAGGAHPTGMPSLSVLHVEMSPSMNMPHMRD